MSNDDTQFAWWSRLRHSGLLLSPVVQIEKYAQPPEEPKWYQPDKLRTAHTRFVASIDRSKDRPQIAHSDILTWVDALLEKYIGHTDQRMARSHSIPESLTAVVRIGSRTETLRPDRVLFDEDGKTPLLLVKADTSPHIGRGKGRTEYARFLELLRGSGHRLGLLTNGLQFRLVYAGLDFESWCEWESERWFEDVEGTEELLGLRQLLFPIQIKDKKGEVIGAGLPGLLHAIEESRKRQADLSAVLRENVRQAVEMILEDVSSASRTDPDLFRELMSPEHLEKPLTDTEAHEALLQATVRVVMRMVVCLFAESRGLLPTGDLIYSQAYGVRTLYELLDETVRHEGSQMGLMSRQSAWPRLMALFRLIHGGSSHGGFPLRPYGGALFRPGTADANDPVARALSILEHKVSVNDATVLRVLKKLLRGPLPVIRGRSKTYVEGPVDYTELRTEFIGLIYEGLLDYRLKRTDEEIGPQVFLNLGRQPVLPLSRLQQMLEDNPKSLNDLFSTLKKEKVSATVASEDEDEDTDEVELDSDEPEAEDDEPVLGKDADDSQDQIHLDAAQAARRWAVKAITETKLIGKQKKRETDTEYQKRIEEAVDDLIDRVVAAGEFYLVRAGNTRKGTGTFYTRPQLAVPTVHRTLEPLCYDKDENGTLVPKKPEEILALKVCDPACGSASFLVAALHYLTEALYKSLCHHCGLDDPQRAGKITLPFGTPATGKDSESTVPLPPDDPNRGEEFAERVQALLRRHVVERCIYGVDINPLAVEFARVSLWVETLDPELPFSFLDHKIKVGNALVGCWLDRFEHYPIAAWERNGGDDSSGRKKGARTSRIEEWLKGETQSNGRRTGEGRIKVEMRKALQEQRVDQSALLAEFGTDVPSIIETARQEYEALHGIPVRAAPEERESLYRDKILTSEPLNRLRQAMDQWCCIWFWPATSDKLGIVPTPLSIHDLFDERRQVIDELRHRWKFFHWEIEFPDVFTVDRNGFDAVVGNPPWETFQQESIEFFSDHDPLYRHLDKQSAIRRQKQLFEVTPNLREQWESYCAGFAALTHWIKSVGNPFDVPLASGNQGKELASEWQSHRARSSGFAESIHPFVMQGTGKATSYKAFFEVAYGLLLSGGRVGFLVPSGLYTDQGSRELRDTLLDSSRWDWLFGFENRRKIFDIDSRFKFAVVIAQKAATAGKINAAFMVRELSRWEQPTPNTVTISPAFIAKSSPKNRSVLELNTPAEVRIFEQVYDASQLMMDKTIQWDVEYARELNMVDDSKLFPPLQYWIDRGYTANQLGFWSDDEGGIAFPLYEGRMIGQFDCSKKGWVSGKGRSAVWRDIPFDWKSIEPFSLISRYDYESYPRSYKLPKLMFMDIGSATNSRTFFGTVVPRLPCGHVVPTLRINEGRLDSSLLLSTLCNSFVFDFVLRSRLSGLHVSWYILEECPLPKAISDAAAKHMIKTAARLSLIHPAFAPEWLCLAELYPELRDDEWKALWAVTEADRLASRVRLEALVADAYGIRPDDLQWIVKDDPDDPKGFWRVEKDLPYEQRLTGLSARAFWALKEGKWSAETVEELSNNEFFEMLGIPELADAEVAKTKGISGPLILKREGCHSWHPENFPEDDPRHGWTWDDCWKDAKTILGSEDAVREYLAGNPGHQAEQIDYTGPRDLFGDPIIEKPKQRKLF